MRKFYVQLEESLVFIKFELKTTFSFITNAHPTVHMIITSVRLLSRRRRCCFGGWHLAEVRKAVMHRVALSRDFSNMRFYNTKYGHIRDARKGISHRCYYCRHRCHSCVTTSPLTMHCPQLHWAFYSRAHVYYSWGFIRMDRFLRSGWIRANQFFLFQRPYYAKNPFKAYTVRKKIVEM